MGLFSPLTSWILRRNIAASYDTEALSELELIGKTAKQLNNLGQDVADLTASIANDMKLSPKGDFSGTLNGMEIEATAPGLTAEVVAAREGQPNLSARINKLPRKIFAGHRGYWNGPTNSLAVENSLEGLREAISAGFNAMECDPRKDSNGTIVLMHDGTVNRTVANHTGDIATLVYSDCILKDKSGASNRLLQTVPTLASIIERAAMEEDFWLVLDFSKNRVTVGEIYNLLSSVNFDKAVYFNVDPALVYEFDKTAVKLYRPADFDEATLDALTAYLPNVYLHLYTADEMTNYGSLIKSKGLGIGYSLANSSLNGMQLSDFQTGIDANQIDILISEVTPNDICGGTVFAPANCTTKTYNSFKDVMAAYNPASTTMVQLIQGMPTNSRLSTYVLGTDYLIPSFISGWHALLTIDKQANDGATLLIVDRDPSALAYYMGVWHVTGGLQWFKLSGAAQS